MKIFDDYSLREYNTFNINVTCHRFLLIENELDFNYLFDNNIFTDKFLLLGGGANMLFTRNFEGNVIHMTNKGITKIAEDSDSVFLQVAAGEDWENFIKYCISNNYYGVENLTGIPGKVGSAPVQNIGAYGVEVKDTLFEVIGREIPSGKIIKFRNEDCDFAYRDSIFKQKEKNKILITDVIFRLDKQSHFTTHYGSIQEELQKNDLPLNLQNIYDTINKIRNSKLPDINRIGSAGSFFKNPIIPLTKWNDLQKKFPHLIHHQVDNQNIKLAAGQLIELCGWKGYRNHDVGVYPLHSLILVNYANATGLEIVELYQEISRSIIEKFGIEIIPEVNII